MNKALPLDELIPDEGVLMFHKTPAYLFPDQITGKDLKCALRAEMQEQIRQAMKIGLKVDGRHYLLSGQYVSSGLYGML